MSSCQSVLTPSPSIPAISSVVFSWDTRDACEKCIQSAKEAWRAVTAMKNGALSTAARDVAFAEKRVIQLRDKFIDFKGTSAAARMFLKSREAHKDLAEITYYTALTDMEIALAEEVLAKKANKDVIQTVMQMICNGISNEQLIAAQIISDSAEKNLAATRNKVVSAKRSVDKCAAQMDRVKKEYANRLLAVKSSEEALIKVQFQFFAADEQLTRIKTLYSILNETFEKMRNSAQEASQTAFAAEVYLDKLDRGLTLK